MANTTVSSNKSDASVPALKIRGLRKSFPKFTLGPLDLSVPRGDIYGLIGPNGAGKTTTIDLIMGMGAKDGGQIEVFGLDHVKEEVAVKKQVGYVSPELLFTAWGNIRRLIHFIKGFYPDWDDAYCDKLMKKLHLGWDDKIATLSFGARTKLSLVVALSHRPALLLLDEPIAGLDAISKQEVYAALLEAVQDESRSVLVSSHNLADIERFTDRVGIIHKGRMLLEGPTSELVERFRIADCSLPEGAATAISGAGFRFLQQDGPHCRLLVDTLDDGLDKLKSLGATDVTLTPVTLEELFVALVKEG